MYEKLSKLNYNKTKKPIKMGEIFQQDISLKKN